MKRIRITRKDIDAVYAAIDFVSTNCDAADDRKYFDELTRRLDRVWRFLQRRQIYTAAKARAGSVIS